MPLSKKKTALETVIGIDIGGTQTKMGLVDRKGKVIGFSSFSSLKTYVIP